MSETAITRRILRAINARPDAKAIKLHGSGWMEVGTPDIHATVAGRSFWLEVKRPGETAKKSPPQYPPDPFAPPSGYRTPPRRTTKTLKKPSGLKGGSRDIRRIGE